MIATHNDKAIYPFIGIVSSILIFVASLLTADKEGYLFLGAVAILLFVFGMGKALLKVLPLGFLLSAIYFGISYLISKNINYGIFGAVRIGGLVLAIVPGISIPVINLSRALNQAKAPKYVSLGVLITMHFFPILRNEIKTIKTAMKTRGVGFGIKSLYRSTILPFCLKLVNISDLLSLSLETRAFGLNKKPTAWKRVPITIRDILYLILVITLFTLALIYLPIIGV